MSTVRLEFIRDKATPVPCLLSDMQFNFPAHMCRDLPVALEGLVADETFHAFCDRLDSWLELLGAEDNREAKLLRFTLGIVLYASIFLPAAIVFLTDITSILLWLGSLLCILTIHCSLLCPFIHRPYGALSRDEIMCKIHAECDNMTHHAPNLSFKVGMSAYDPMSTPYIDHICVCTSLSTQESGVASLPEVIVLGVDDTTIEIDNDKNESDTEAKTMSSTSSGDAAMEHV
jgi:hypothetical protein